MAKQATWRICQE